MEFANNKQRYGNITAGGDNHLGTILFPYLSTGKKHLKVHSQK